MEWKCCNLENGDGGGSEELDGEVSGGQSERLVDELILFANIIVADPLCHTPFGSCASPRIPNRSPGCSELAKALAFTRRLSTR